MSDQWVPAPVAQQFPAAPTTPAETIAARFAALAQQAQEATANLLRTAGVRARPGRITSLDFDGVDRGDLGTRGWSLGADSDGADSYLALNGIDVYADLQAKDVLILGLIQQLTDQQNALAAQVARIDALVNNQVTVATATANTGGAVAIGAGISYGVASVSVPAGFTRAGVIGVTSVTATGSAPAVQVQTDISGNLGFQLPIYGSSGDIVATGATSHAATFTGLAGGAITVGGRVAGVSGVTNAYFVNTVIATFYR